MERACQKTNCIFIGSITENLAIFHVYLAFVIDLRGISSLVEVYSSASRLSLLLPSSPYSTLFESHSIILVDGLFLLGTEVLHGLK